MKKKNKKADSLFNLPEAGKKGSEGDSKAKLKAMFAKEAKH